MGRLMQHYMREETWRRARKTQTRQWHAGTDPQCKKESAAYYREYAAQIRELANGEVDTALRDRLTAVADAYEKLADQLDRRP